MGRADRIRRLRTLWNAQAGLCAWCWKGCPHPDEALAERRALGVEVRPGDPTLDHVIPRSRRGPNDLRNLLLMHSRCNAARGDRPLCEAALEMHRRVLAYLDARARIEREEAA